MSDILTEHTYALFAYNMCIICKSSMKLLNQYTQPWVNKFIKAFNDNFLTASLLVSF